MKIPVHIIGEKKRREIDRRREEAKRAPVELPHPGAGCRRPTDHKSRMRVVVIQM